MADDDIAQMIADMLGKLCAIRIVLLDGGQQDLLAT